MNAPVWPRLQCEDALRSRVEGLCAACCRLSSSTSDRGGRTRSDSGSELNGPAGAGAERRRERKSSSSSGKNMPRTGESSVRVCVCVCACVCVRGGECMCV